MLIIFSVSAKAQIASGGLEDIYGSVFSSIDSETRELLQSAGVKDGDLNSLMGLSPGGVMELLGSLFGKTAREQAALFASGIVVIVLIRVFGAFVTSPGLKETSENLGAVFLVFTLTSSSAVIAQSCVSALKLTKSFMLALIPVLTSILAFSGNPSGALSVNAGVFAFAEGICVTFTDMIVPLTAAGAALGTAAAVSPVSGIEKFSSIVNRTVTAAMGFAAGIFSAVISIKGVIAGAGDSLTLRGLKFFVGGSVPVVGSAIGDALGSVSAGLGLIKNSVCALGLLAVVFINLPPLCSLIVFKLMLYMLSMASEMFEIKKIPDFISVFRSIFNVIMAAMLFSQVVFIISLAVIITLKAA
ncbi:MAG: hypothetical protein IJS90_07065 [Clostridia bacterium]|nr:hypothetical protein [Clostridia bacterium]